MQRQNIHARLQPIFRDQFNDESLTISDETSSADILDWDSLAHIRLVIAVEAEFGGQFSTEELAELKNVGDMILAIQHKLFA